MLDTSKLPDSVEELKKIIQLQQKEITAKQETINIQKEKINQLENKLFGRKSEKWTKQEKEEALLFNEIETYLHTDEVGVNTDKKQPELIDVKSHTRVKTGRRPLPAYLERRVVPHDIDESEKICKCGSSLNKIGEEISEKLQMEPPKAYVNRHIRFKYSCPKCEGLEDDTKPAVKIAPVPKQIVPKSQIGHTLLAYFLIAKFADGIPFYRMENILSRSGIDISRTTMCNSAITAYHAIKPVTDSILEYILSSPYLQIDETRLQVLKEPGRSPTALSYVWVFYGKIHDKPFVYYHYEPTRSAQFMKTWFQNFNGIVHTDGYPSYDSFFEEFPNITHASCWVHARRKFIESKKAQPRGTKNTSIDWILDRIGDLYQIEELAKEQALNEDELLKLRQDKSKLIVEELKAELDKLSLTVLTGSSFGKAISYTLGQWTKLLVFLDNPKVKLDTNDVENRIRPFVIGRKNWLFSASVDGARASMAYYTLIENAKLSGIDPYTYLKNLFETYEKENQPLDLNLSPAFFHTVV